MATISKKANQIARQYIKSLPSWLKVKKALLFGSVARGKMNKHSDIDIIVLSDEFKKMDLMKRLILLSRLRSQKFLEWPMDILGYTPEEFQKLTKISSMFSDAKKQGIEIR